MRSDWNVSIRRTCRVFLVDTSTYHYKSRRLGQAALEQRIREICRTRVRYGCRRVHVLLRREGCSHGQNKTQRIGDLVPSIERPTEYLSVNVQGTVHMLECAPASGGALKKFVYAASSSCYGLADVPTSEDHPIRPEHPYALSKNLGEQACLHWHKVYGLPLNVIRISNAYGPRSRTSGAYGAVFGVFLCQKLAGKPFTVVGDGTQRRDFIFVTDVARAFFAACDTPLSGHVWNVGAGNPQSVNRLVERLQGEAVHIPRRPGESDCTFADISRIRRKLGWEPQVSFEQGVAEVLANIDYWRDAPLWDPASIAQATEGWFRYLAR